MGIESTGGQSPAQEKLKELSESEQELATLTTQQEQLELVMESLKMERVSVGGARAETRDSEDRAQQVSDAVIESSLETGSVSEEDNQKIVSSEQEVEDAKAWEAGMLENRTVHIIPQTGSLADGPFREKLSSLGVDIDALTDSRGGGNEALVQKALRDRHHELTMQIRAKTMEVPGGKQKLVSEMLKGQNGPMGTYATSERTSLIKRAKMEGQGASVAELYTSINPDRTYPLEARKEALGFIARATVRDMGGSPDSGESLAKALGEYAEADAAVHDKPYLEGESSLDYMEREQTLERAREQGKLLQELSNTMSSVGEDKVVVSSFPGTLPSFFKAGTNEVIAQTDDGYDGRRKHGFPQEVKGLFENQETLSGAEVAERLKPLIESVQAELQGAETAQEEREEAERKIEELGSKKIGQDLTVA